MPYHGLTLTAFQPHIPRLAANIKQNALFQLVYQPIPMYSKTHLKSEQSLII